MKLGLSLSGGGIKAATHIGALKAFEESKITFDVITGASSGSIVATLYSIGYTSDEILEIFKKFSKKIKYVSLSNIFKLMSEILFFRKIRTKGFNNGHVIEKTIKEICKKKNIKNISDIKMPLGITSVDMYENKTIAFISSNILNNKSKDIHYINDVYISTAIKASSAYPGIFDPVYFKNYCLVDGGLKENTPWKLAKDLGANKVVNIIFNTPYKKCKCDNIFQVVESSINILSKEAALCDLEGAECLIEIPIKEGVNLLESKFIDELYSLGYETTWKKIKEIKNL